MPTPMVLRSPADILCLVPFLLGFQPVDSIVVIGLRDREIVFQLRGDLAEAVAVADHYATVISRQQVTAAVVIGYGPAAAVTPAVLAVAPRLAALGLRLRDVLRVTDGRYWSYLCESTDCCPIDGVRFDASTSPVTATAVVNGHVVLPSRAALRDRLAPVEGLTREGMRRATERAERRLTALVEAAGAHLSAALRAAGAAALRAAVSRQRDEGQLDDDEVAWLAALLDHLPVRDDAWAAIDRDPALHVRLWTEVVRRAEPRVVRRPGRVARVRRLAGRRRDRRQHGRRPSADRRPGLRAGATAQRGARRRAAAVRVDRRAAPSVGQLRQLRQPDPIGPGVDVHPGPADEAGDREPCLLRQLHRQRAGRGYRGEDRYPGHPRLLYQFEADPPGDHEHVTGQR